MVKADLKLHAQIISFTQMLSNQRLLKIRISKAVTEAGHFGLTLLLAALKRASDPIIKMMLWTDEFEWPVPRDSSWDKPLLENPAAGRITDMATGGVEESSYS